MAKPYQSPLVCHGHSRPIVELSYSAVTEDGVFLISASKGAPPRGSARRARRQPCCWHGPPRAVLQKHRRKGCFLARAAPLGSGSRARARKLTPAPDARADGKPMLRNGETGDWVGTFEGHKGAVWGACLNTLATHAATASADFSARVWDAIKGEEVFNFAHKHIVRTVAFSQARAARGRACAAGVRRAALTLNALARARLLSAALQDSKRLLTGGHEKVIRVFDLMSPDADPQLLEGSPAPVRNGLWHANDTLILAAANDVPGVRVWDVRAKGVVRTLDTADAVTDVCVCGGLLVTASGKEVRTWDAATFEPKATFTLDFPVYTAAVCQAKGRFVAAGADMWPRLFELASGTELECNKGHHGPVHSVRFHPSGESYASGSEDGTIRIWSTTTAAEAAAAADGSAAAA